MGNSDNRWFGSWSESRKIIHDFAQLIGFWYPKDHCTIAFGRIKLVESNRCK